MARNDITGDLIASRASNQEKYAANWDRIFGKPKADADFGKKEQEPVAAWEMANGSVVEFVGVSQEPLRSVFSQDDADEWYEPPSFDTTCLCGETKEVKGWNIDWKCVGCGEKCSIFTGGVL